MTLVASPAMPRVFSGIQPTGEIHLGNYLGAVQHWVDRPGRLGRARPDPLLRRRPPRDHAAVGHRRPTPRRPAAPRCCCSPPGLDPERCTLFVQSHVHEHTDLTWILNCIATFGELRPHDPVQGEVGGPGVGERRACSTTRCSWPPTSSPTTPSGCRWATTSASTSSSPATSPSGSTTAAATRSSCPRPSSRRSAPGSWTCRTPTAQDVEVGRLAPGHDQAPRRPEGDHQAHQERGHRLRERDPLRPRRQAGRVEPAADPRRGHRPAGRGRRGRVRGLAATARSRRAVADAVVEFVRPLQARYAELEADPAEVDAHPRRRAPTAPRRSRRRS